MAIEVMPLKDAARGILKGVAALIILKAFRRIDVPLLVVAQATAQVTHVRAGFLLSEGNRVLRRAIFAVHYHRTRFSGGVLLMLGDQVGQLRAVIAETIGRLEPR